MSDFYDETPRHKKKSQAKPPAKAKHKHIFEPCILEFPHEWYLKEHVRTTDDRKSWIYGFCPVCGKIGEVDRSRWLHKERDFLGSYMFVKDVLTDEGEKEMNSKTRTLPTFIVENPFAKFVKNEESVDDQ